VYVNLNKNLEFLHLRKKLILDKFRLFIIINTSTVFNFFNFNMKFLKILFFERFAD